MKLREFVEQASKLVDIMFTAQGRIYPMYHFTTKGGDRVMPAYLGDKDASVELAKSVLAVAEATRVVHIDEAWTLEGGPEVMETYLRNGSIENCPDRVEVVLFSAEDSTEGALLAHRRIVRDENAVARLGALEFLEMSTSEGRMVGLLPTTGRAH